MRINADGYIRINNTPKMNHPLFECFKDILSTISATLTTGTYIDKYVLGAANLERGEGSLVIRQTYSQDK